MSWFVKFFILFLSSSFCWGNPATLYSSLDPRSITQHLAFYSLYKETSEGKEALRHACKLLFSNQCSEILMDENLVKDTTQMLIGLNQPQSHQVATFCDDFGQNLYNRNLRGYWVKNEREVLELPIEQIDIAHALLLAQLGENNPKIKFYETLLDLMSLQIKAQARSNHPEAILDAINQFIFEEIQVRFPPHSLYEQAIDQYTFLPSVLESRRGVCLGVSVLYLCIAQRLGVQLEAVTPPGHIFVRYTNAKGQHRNIETTARGIHLDDDEYLTINTKALQIRNLREVIGLTFFNQASVYVSVGKVPEAIAAYEHAHKYLKDDPQLLELLGYQYLLNGNEFGYECLKKVRKSNFLIKDNTMLEDFLSNKVGIEAIQLLFKYEEDHREAVLKRKDDIQKILTEYPEFRMGWFSLAMSWIALHRQREALEALKHYISIENEDPAAEYYLALLYAKRLDVNRAWGHLERAEELAHSKAHDPDCLFELRRELNLISPQYTSH